MIKSAFCKPRLDSRFFVACCRSTTFTTWNLIFHLRFVDDIRLTFLFWLFLYFGIVIQNSSFPEKISIFWKIKRNGVRTTRLSIHHMEFISDNGHSARTSSERTLEEIAHDMYVKPGCQDTLASVNNNDYLYQNIRIDKMYLSAFWNKRTSQGTLSLFFHFLTQHFTLRAKIIVFFVCGRS